MDLMNNNYYCETCKYKCHHESHWNQHINTVKHKNNGKIKRNRPKENLKCPHCTFNTNMHGNYKTHILTKHSTSEDRKTKFTFYCEQCDFGTFGKINYDRHCESQKHINNTKL